MKLRLRYFASIREALGAEQTIEVSAGITVGEIRDALIAGGDPYAQVLARGRLLRCALNQQLCGDDAVVGEGAELAFFPPVTGG